MGSRYNSPIGSTSITRQCKEAIALKPLAERLLGITINGDRFNGEYLGSQGKDSCVIYNKSKKGYPIIKDYATGKVYDAYSLLTDIAGLSPKDAVNELKRLAGIGEDVTSKLNTRQLLTLKRKLKQQHAKLAAEQTKEQRSKDRNIKTAIKRWWGKPETGSSGYLEAKGVADVPCASLRYSRNGDAHLLLCTIGERATFKRVGIQKLLNKPNAQGKNKVFVWGSATSGAFSLIGTWGLSFLRNAETPAYIAEGYATAATIYKATRKPVIVALNAGNLEKVTEAIKKYANPLKDIVIVPDNDQYKPTVGNVGLEKAHKAAFNHGAKVAPPPQFKDTTSKPTDYNDLEQLEGLAEVKRQLLATPPTIDINLAFKKDIEKSNRYIQEMVSSGRATLGTKEHPYMPDMSLTKGVSVYRAPHGTGKTLQVKRLVAQAQAANLRILYITPSAALTRDGARRLGLESYNDIDGRAIRWVGGLACCLNSLPRLLSNDTKTYDLVIIDEIEQMVSCLDGDHIKDKHRVLEALEFFINRAQSLVCLDADAGQLTRQFLKEYRPHEAPKWTRHYYPVGQGRLVNLYEYKGDLYEKILDCKKTMIVFTNSKVEAERIDYGLKTQGKKGKLITSETSDKEQQFLADIDNNSIELELDYLICSPSVSTGVSLESGYFKCKFGIFNSFVSSPEKALQAFWRVRTHVEYHLYIDSRGEKMLHDERYNIEAKYNELLSHEAEQRPTSLLLHHNDRYKSIVTAAKKFELVRRSRYKNNFIKLMLSQGFEFNYKPAKYFLDRENEDRKTLTNKKLLNSLRDNARQARLNGIADRKNEHYSEIRDELIEYYRIKEDENIKPWAIVDDRGRYKGRFKKLASTLSSAFLDQHEKELADKHRMAIDMPAVRSQREFFERVLQAVNFDEAIKVIAQADFDTSKEALNSLLIIDKLGAKATKTDISKNLQKLRLKLPRYNRSTLEPLRLWVEDNREWLEGLRLPTPEKLKANLMRYVGSWLKRMGLNQAIVGHKGVSSNYTLGILSLPVASETLLRHGVLFTNTSIKVKSTPCQKAPAKPQPQPLPTASPPPVAPHPIHENMPQNEVQAIKTIGDVLNLIQKRLNDGFFDGLPSIDSLKTYLSRAHSGDREAATAVIGYSKQLMGLGVL